MNKKEMAAELAKKTGLSQVKALECLNAIFSADPSEGIIAAELDAGNKVLIAGFGTFTTRERAGRMGTKPNDPNVRIEIPARRYVHFKPGKTLRERVSR